MNDKLILIADDHPVLRAGIKRVIMGQTGFQNIIEAETGDRALELIMQKQPDIAVLDIQMPGVTGMQIAEKLENADLKTSIILLTMFDDKNIFLKALELGVKGYILKDSTESEIAEAVNKVAEGEFYLCPRLSALLVKDKSKMKNKNLFKQLTESEIKILSLVAELKSNDEIADELYISKRTVENHKTSISKKLNLPSSKNLLKFAVENKDQL